MIKLKLELCSEVEEYLSIKKKSTADVYRPGLKLFISFFKERYGKEKTFTDFLDMLEENSRRAREKIPNLSVGSYLFLDDSSQHMEAPEYFPIGQ